MTDLSDGYIVGDGIVLEWSPKDTSGDPITGVASSITLTIKEPGEEAATFTDTDLSEDAGTYSYTHKITAAGVTKGSWFYDGPGNADGAENFQFYAAPRE